MKNLKRLLFISAACILMGCGTNDIQDDTVKDKAEEETEDERDDEDVTDVSEEENNPDEVISEDDNDDEMSPAELFKAFCNGEVEGKQISYYDGAVTPLDMSEYVFANTVADDEDVDITTLLEVCDPVDLDNDGEKEFVLFNPVYGYMCFDCKDGEVICFAQGAGTTAVCDYTKYDGEYWIVHKDTTHMGRVTFELTKYNGDLEVTDSFNIGMEDWDEDGVWSYYLDDTDLTEEEYNELIEEIFN